MAAEVGGTYCRLDVTSPQEWRAALEKTRTEHGRIDGLVNNAGVHQEGGVLEVDEATIRLITEINRYGVIFGMTAVAPIMRTRVSAASSTSPRSRVSAVMARSRTSAASGRYAG